MSENTKKSRTDRLSYLQQKASDLPKRPGVYIMKDSAGNVIYVGKSKTLKNRVSQYFHYTNHSAKTKRMVDSVYDFDYILCDTETEALALENSKIKQFEPKYNIKLKDDKSYPYILLTKEDYPRLVITRKRINGAGTYFGPYSSGQTAREILRTVSRIYGIPSCKKVFPRDIGRTRPCLNSQIGRCCAPCTGNISKDEYNALTDAVRPVLRGDINDAVKMLNDKMLACSEELAFESAAKYRDRITALKSLYKNQKVIAATDTEYDVIGIYRGNPVSVISVFYIRSGIISDTESFSLGAYAIDGDEEIESFLCGIYEKRGYVPKEILIHESVFQSPSELLVEYFEALRGKSVTVTYPQRGEKAQLCRLVCDNARQKAVQYETEAVKNNDILFSLAKTLALEVVPERIEAYDISNYGSEHITAGMIVCENGTLKKSAYRVFNIKSTDGQDDYAAMAEALGRRLDNYEEKTSGFDVLPDLILLDGGASHTSVIRNLFDARGYANVPIFGMVKDEYHKTRALTDADCEISLSRTDALFVFIYKLQEEVHRFTFGKMQKAKRKSLKTSSLTAIKGVGPKKAAVLLESFETLERLKGASVEDIEKIKGINRQLAEEIVNHFKAQGGK